jgi:acyl-CoA hydrolase
MDLTAAICATRRAKGPCVTVCVEKIEFKKPIFLGDIVTIGANITKIGRTSMEIEIKVIRESCESPGGREHCLTGKMTFVAVDKRGKPRELPL